LESAYTTSGACTAAGFTWRTRATTIDACAAQGTFCQMPDYSWDVSIKDASACAACGGTIVPAYTWSPALWVSGFVLELAETNRTWTGVNTWGPTINQTKLSSVIELIVIEKFVPVVKTMLQCAYLPFLTILDEAACACSGDTTAPADCFPTLSTVAQIAEGVAFSGLEAKIVSNGVTITITNDSVTVQEDMKNISIYIVLPPPTSSSKRAAAAYTTVVDSNGNVIGQLYGDQKQVSFGDTLSGSGFSLCLDLTSTPSNCNAPAIVYSATADTASTVASTSVTTTATQMCGSGFTQSGYYAPAYLCVASSSTTSGTSSGSTGATASTTAAATTVQASSTTAHAAASGVSKSAIINACAVIVAVVLCTI